jgi:hypothetical protein
MPVFGRLAWAVHYLLSARLRNAMLRDQQLIGAMR